MARVMARKQMGRCQLDSKTEKPLCFSDRGNFPNEDVIQLQSSTKVAMNQSIHTVI